MSLRLRLVAAALALAVPASAAAQDGLDQSLRTSELSVFSLQAQFAHSQRVPTRREQELRFEVSLFRLLNKIKSAGSAGYPLKSDTTETASCADEIRVTFSTRN